MNDVVKNFIDSDNACILINGVWGIGKTHTLMFDVVKKYQENHPMTVEFAYSSLFGKKSIDEINTELYTSLHPKLNKALKTINPLIKLIDVGFTMSGINVGFNSKQLKNYAQIKGKKKSKVIAILDDLERINTNDISHKDVMGYINKLITQGVKVIVLAHLEEIKDKTQYEEYKEKIFDRIYNIDSSNKEIIKTLTQENSCYVVANILNLIDNNLRIIKKSNNLFNQIVRYIEKENLKFDNFKELYTVCCYCIMDIMTSKFSSLLLKSESQNYKYATESQIRVLAFEKYIKEKYLFSSSNYSGLIYAVIEILENESYELLNELLNPKSQYNNPLCSESIFYLSDTDKKTLIKTQFAYIENKKDFSSTDKNNLSNVIKDWYKYYHYDLSELIDEQIIFNKLKQNDLKFHKFNDEPYLNSFIDRYEEYLKAEKIKEIKSMINNYSTDKFDYYSFQNLLLTNYSNDTTEIIINEIKCNQFLISNIHNTMKPQDWGLAHDICRFFTNQSEKHKRSLYNYLNKYKRKYAQDNSLQIRINSLIEQYSLRPENKK